MIRALVVSATLALALAIACRIPDEHLHLAADAARSDDAGIDANLGPCDLTAPWGPAAPVPGLANLKSVVRFTADEKAAYFALGPDGTATTAPDTLFVATRADAGSSFGSATELTGVNGSDGESTPSLSPDGTAIYYVWGEQPLHTGSDRDIYRAVRTGSNFAFGSGAKLGFNLPGDEDDYPSLASNGDMWFASQRGTDTVVSIYTAPSVGGSAFGNVVRADELNSTTSANAYPLLSPDLLHVFFQRNGVVYTATRGSPAGTFQTPATVDELDTGDCSDTANAFCRPAWISPDGCRLYLGLGPSNGAVSTYVVAKPPYP